MPKTTPASRAAAPFLLLLILICAGVARAQNGNVYLPDAATVGEEYNYVLRVSGVVPAKWEIVKGSMPPGIDLGQTSGLFFGLPTEAGTYAFTVKMTDASNKSVDYQLELVVTGGTPTLLVPVKGGGGARAGGGAAPPGPGRGKAPTTSTAVTKRSGGGQQAGAGGAASGKGDGDEEVADKPAIDRPVTAGDAMVSGYVPAQDLKTAAVLVYPSAPENAPPLVTLPVTVGADGRFKLTLADSLLRGQKLRVRARIEPQGGDAQTLLSDPVEVERGTAINTPIKEGTTEIKGVADKSAGQVFAETDIEGVRKQVTVARVDPDTGEFTVTLKPLGKQERLKVYREGRPAAEFFTVISTAAPVLKSSLLEGARTISGYSEERSSKVEVEVLAESEDGLKTVHRTPPTAVNSDTGEFNVAVPEGLVAGQRVKARVQNSDEWSTPQTVETLGDWGRVRAYFGIGMMLSKEATQSFSRRDLYLNFNIDSNWYHRPHYSDVLKETEQQFLSGSALDRFTADDDTKSDAAGIKAERDKLKAKLEELENFPSFSPSERMAARRDLILASLTRLRDNTSLSREKRELIQQVVDKLQQHGVRHWDIQFNTFFDARLTPVAVSGQGSAASGLGTDAFGNFVTNEKGALMQVGAYAPIFDHARMTWNYQGSRNAVFFGPTGRVGVQTLVNKASLADPKVFEDNDLFNFFALGARFGHYKLSGSDDRAPQLISYLDIMRGRWQNLERRIPTGEKNAAGEDIFVRRRPLRWALEGRLKIPALPFVIGFDSNIGEGPDDLRFLFGTNFDVAQLFNLLR